MRVILALALIAAAGTGAAAADERRVALIVGNSRHDKLQNLKNPVEDAAGMQIALQRLGFRMVVGQDLSLEDFRNKVAEFDKEVRKADIALLFYAGHGVQYNGLNYLLPTDIELKSQGDIIAKSIPLNTILEAMARHAKTSVIFLDACRDSPQAPAARTSSGLAAAVWSFGRGLAPLQEAASDRFVGYAAAPGLTALDGKGKNSPFTRALLKHISTPEQDINTMFSLVRRDVLAATGNRQQPEATTALTRPLYLNAGPAAVQRPDSPSAGPDDGQPTIALSADAEFWLAIKDTNDAKHFEEYLRQFPAGRFVILARKKVDELKVAMLHKEAVSKPRPSPAEPLSDDGEFLNVLATARISKSLPKAEAERSARALARARAILAKVRIAWTALPGTVASSAQAADLLVHMAHGITHEEHWTPSPTRVEADEVTVELRAKVRPFKAPAARNLSGSIEPSRLVAGQPFQLKLHAKREARIGVFAWQANGTILRLYPAPAGKDLVIKPGETLSLPRANDPYPALSSATMPGEKTNHEAIIIVTGSAPMRFETIAATAISREIQTSPASRSEDFLNQLASNPDPDVEILVLPYEVRADH